MRSKLRKIIVSLGLPVCLCVACGNKGDLYLIPDELSDENLRRLEQALAIEDIPAADAVEVDDNSVFDTTERNGKDTNKGK